MPVPASASSVPPSSMTVGDGGGHAALPFARLEARHRARNRARVRTWSLRECGDPMLIW